MNGKLTVVERGSFRRHEAVIEKGMATFIEVGLALKTIRDDQLYRESHKTFEKYAEDRWGMHKRRAYQLIDAAEIETELCTMVHEVPRIEEITNERQIRELSDVPTENIPEVIEKASEIAGDDRITAKVIHEAKLELYGENKPKEKQEPSPYVEQEPAKAPKMSKAEQAVFNATMLSEILKTLRQAKKLTNAVENVPGMEMFLARQRSIEREILTACDAVHVTIPHSVCPRCKGKGCAQCGNHGWVNHVLARELENVK